MAISWTPQQLQRVEAAITAHPADSHRCVDLARELQPIARQRDRDAHALIITPQDDGARYVIPRNGPTRWQFHVTTAVELHCVDVLTGSPGTEEERYLALHWQYSEALRMAVVDPEAPWL